MDKFKKGIQGVVLDIGQVVFDQDKLLAYVGGDYDAVRECIELFPAVIGPMLDEIAMAIQNKDYEKGLRLAHTLKGASANVAAPRLRQAVCELEKNLRLGAADVDTLQTVKKEYGILVERLNSFMIFQDRIN